MRLMQVATFYPAYLATFYARRPDLAAQPYSTQIAALLEDGFGAGHMIAPYMQDLGYEVGVVIANCIEAQTQWALENGRPRPQNQNDLLALTAAQIEAFKPDIAYMLEASLHDSRFFAAVAHKPKVLAGWRAAPIAAGTDWRSFDLILSSDEGYRNQALSHGARAVRNFMPGFSQRIADAIADTPKNADVSFCGQITGEHRNRIEGLVQLAQFATKENWSTRLHLGMRRELTIAPELRAADAGAVWGMDMYRAVRGGRICPNFHINAAVTRAQNMRLLEVTGCGSFMLTEADDHLQEVFEVGREVETFASLPELREKVSYYLAHEKEREDIARRGQERCMRDHGMDKRAAWLDDIFREAERAPKPVASAPAPVKAIASFADAKSLYDRGLMAEAANVLNLLIQQDARNTKALHLLGCVALAVRQEDRAAELFAAARALGHPGEERSSGADFLQRTFPGVSFGHDVQITGISGTRIGAGACIGDGAWVNIVIRDAQPRMFIGEGVLIGRRSHLSSGTHLEIGAFTLLGPNVYVASIEHQYEGNHLKPMLQTGMRDLGRLVVEENCWLGMNSVVSGGFTMGRGSVVGANSVLRSGIPPFSIAVGTPARIVRMYNPKTDKWESVSSDADRARIEDARASKPLPGREEFLAQLRAANNGRSVPAIVGGRGEHIV